MAKLVISWSALSIKFCFNSVKNEGPDKRSDIARNVTRNIFPLEMATSGNFCTVSADSPSQLDAILVIR